MVDISKGQPLLRNASLSITREKIELGCADDLGGSHALGNIPLQDIRRIRLKKNAITPGPQLLKPAMSGAFVGVVLMVIIWLQVGGLDVSKSIKFLGFAIPLVLFLAGLFVVVNLGKVVWSHLAVVVLSLWMGGG